MQLRHLETFVTIVDCKTLTAAASRLYKTQGAVSQDLRALEAELGLELVDRSGQRVELTPAGRALLPMARRLLRELEDARVEMARIRAGESAIVRLACLPSLGLKVTRLIADFSEAHPAVRWSLFGDLHKTMIERLNQGELDFAICEAKTDEGVTNVPLDREPLKIVISGRSPLARAPRLAPADLLNVPYVGFALDMGSSIEAQRFFAAGDGYPSAVVEVDDARLVLDLVDRFGGFGILPASVLPTEGPYVVVEPDPSLVRQISLARLSGRELSSAASEFAEYVTTNWIRSAPYQGPEPARFVHLPPDRT